MLDSLRTAVAKPPKPLPIHEWLELDSARSLLDVGCNVGALLTAAQSRNKSLELAGVEVNRVALEAARRNLSSADLREAGAQALPFEDERFDRVSCIEVLEHVPEHMRRKSIEEMHRVLRPNGRLVLQVPHAGLFDFLDPNNIRFRFPRLFARAIGKGLRERGTLPDGIVWHQHFTVPALAELVNGLFTMERFHFGGLALVPLCDMARWPFYKMRWYENPACRLLQRVSAWDMDRDYGEWAYDVRVLLVKV